MDTSAAGEEGRRLGHVGVQLGPSRSGSPVRAPDWSVGARPPASGSPGRPRGPAASCARRTRRRRRGWSPRRARPGRPRSAGRWASARGGRRAPVCRGRTTARRLTGTLARRARTAASAAEMSAIPASHRLRSSSRSSSSMRSASNQTAQDRGGAAAPRQCAVVAALEVVTAQDRRDAQPLGQYPAEPVGLVGEDEHGIGVGCGAANLLDQIARCGSRGHHVRVARAQGPSQRALPRHGDHRRRIDQTPDRLQVIVTTDGGRVGIDRDDEGGDQARRNRGLDEPEMLALPSAVGGDEHRLRDHDQPPCGAGCPDIAGTIPEGARSRG